MFVCLSVCLFVCLVGWLVVWSVVCVFGISICLLLGVDASDVPGGDLPHHAEQDDWVPRERRADVRKVGLGVVRLQPQKGQLP
jgi:hypothetical protein